MAPKSATSAFMYFSKHHRSVLRQTHSELSFGDLGKTIGAMWKSAHADEKRPFEEQAAMDRVRFSDEVSRYQKRDVDDV